MDMNEEKIIPVLEKLGYEPGNRGNEHIWRRVIDDIPYGVDFKTGDIFRLMYGSREYDVPGDEHLLKLKTTIEDIMSATNGDRREAEAEPSTTKEEPETPASVPSEPQQDKPVEQPAPEQPKPENLPTKSSILDMIHGYVGNDVLEVFGDTGSGKSKFALTIARDAIEAGKKVYYLDTERNLTDADIKSLMGCEYKYTPVIEEIDKLVQKLPAVDVVIIDSIGFPVLTSYARLSVKQKGDALLKLIAIFGDLKKWAYLNNGIAIVTNQPESEFNKEPGHVLRPFGDKSQFAAKEIWKTEITSRNERETNIIIKSFRSRSIGHGAKIASMKITGAGVEMV